MAGVTTRALSDSGVHRAVAGGRMETWRSSDRVVRLLVLPPGLDVASRGGYPLILQSNDS